ncbi:OmpP1/FadL family transporter [Ponticaulis sp.]|uniref:OmpP1/FadL family transporter n=1 Tax=Ponticaulis sp. TaxID=2020902 RepID=UPI000B6EF1BC|nr:outer membrane protein transport protein [Ponticaulis sp.]MAI90369.1 aromatic hydrocarbon degradation protein [Ponticaulis sp.]OUY00071.1 MAG: hypothetical protein CBB65_08005 [Hyphomonadaceae bacterium TMED5]|tara:strand:+ start:343551 stop:344873 length:1323 start_codon:yes stop_codon:yes gene_type:complete
MKTKLLGIGLLAATMLSPTALADSFAISEYGASDLGRANSGRVTQTEDASAAYGNPALMTGFEDSQVSAGLSAILGTSSYRDTGSVDALGAPLGGNTSGFLEDGYVPYGHVVYAPDARWRLGLSVTAPFGLATEYEADWPGRYQAIKSSLQAININPSAAYAVTDTFSVGAGLNLQYVTAELSSAIDFGAVCFAQVDPTTCASAGLTPQAADGLTDIEGEDWSVGWNVGASWMPHPDWTLGIHYRSEIDHELEGDADFTVPAQAQLLTASGAFADTPGTAALNLPASTEIGARWQATERLAVYADAIWTEWSSLEELRVDFENPVQPDAVEELSYKDAGRYSIGADYAVNDRLTLRAGYAYDETPVQPEDRSARIPDNDRQIFALGGSYDVNDFWTIDAAYNRVEIDETDFDQTGSYADQVMGVYSGHADVISVGVSRTF